MISQCNVMLPALFPILSHPFFSAARVCAAQVLVISQCNVMLPDAVRKMPKLERLVRCQLPLLCG